MTVMPMVELERLSCIPFRPKVNGSLVVGIGIETPADVVVEAVQGSPKSASPVTHADGLVGPANLPLQVADFRLVLRQLGGLANFVLLFIVEHWRFPQHSFVAFGEWVD